MLLLGDIWDTGKLAFQVYRSILFDDGPIIKVDKSLFPLLGLIACYIILWSS